MRFIPHSIYKLIENLPNPWENIKYVKAIYHKSGSYTIIEDIPKYNILLYKSLW